MSTIEAKFGGAKAAIAALEALAEKCEFVGVDGSSGRNGVILPIDRKFEDLTDNLALRGVEVTHTLEGL